MKNNHYYSHSCLHLASFRLTLHKNEVFVKDFFSKCDQIRGKLRIWSHLLKKSIMENFIFCEVLVYDYVSLRVGKLVFQFLSQSTIMTLKLCQV